MSSPAARAARTMSLNKIAASTPYLRTGWSVISVIRSGLEHASSIAVPGPRGPVLGQRPARLAHVPHRRVGDRLAAAGPDEC